MKRRYNAGCVLLALATQAGAAQPLSAYTHFETYLIGVSEASGVTYDWDTDTLFAIGDEGEAVYQLTKTGQIIDSMAFDFNVSPRSLRALDDAEGVAYLGNNKFMFADERDFMGRITSYKAGSLVTQADIDPDSYSFDYLHNVGYTNTGLEGVAYDPIEKAMWGIKELGPVGVYKMVGVPDLAGASTSTITVNEPIERRYITRWEALGVTQISDIYALSACAAFPEGDPRRMNLLLLSRDGHKILEITRTGTVVDSLDIGPIGRGTIEGITMDKDGVIYLVSEGSTAAQEGDPKRTAGLHVVTPPEPSFKVNTHQVNIGGETVTIDLGWDSTPGQSYVIEYAPELAGDWQTVSQVYTATGGQTTGTSSAVPSSSKGFFRIRKVIP